MHKRYVVDLLSVKVIMTQFGRAVWPQQEFGPKWLLVVSVKCQNVPVPFWGIEGPIENL